MNDHSETWSSEATESKGFLRRLSALFSHTPRDKTTLREVLFEAYRQGVIDREAFSMIERVLHMSELRVRDVMVPRAQMEVVRAEKTLEEVLPFVVETAHSRFPVVGEDRSQVEGILLAKDILPHVLHKTLHMKVRQIMRPALFVPESKRLNAMLQEFRSCKQHMAIVVDEYGTASGLITIEDVLEQIVGEIADEHDEPEAYIFRHGNHAWTVKAITPLEEFNRHFGTRFESEEVETIGGLIVHHLGRVPRRGEKIEYGGFIFEVIRADKRRVHLFRVRPKEKSAAETHGCPKIEVPTASSLTPKS